MTQIGASDEVIFWMKFAAKYIADHRSEEILTIFDTLNSAYPSTYIEEEEES